MQRTKLTLINTNLKRYTFQSPRIRQWVESRSSGMVLNLFAGITKLSLNEIRVDIDIEKLADYHMDVLDFCLEFNEVKIFDTVIIDPPYSYRKSMEMYNGYRCSRFKRLADEIPKLLKKDGVVISFGYHSTFLGKKRGFYLKELCTFAHGGAQHCTIGIVESRINENNG